MIKNLKNHYLAIIILIVSLIIGGIVFDDYGISWDERQQRNIGTHSYDYVFNKDASDLKSFNDKDYGVALELPLIILEKELNLVDTRSIYLMRHLVSHYLFLFSAFIFYLLIFHLYNKRFLAVTGYLMLLLSPAIYAHSFFNTKDIPFMSMFIISFYFLILAFRERKLLYYILLGISVGILINLRIMGILLVMVITGLSLYDFLIKFKSKEKIVFSYSYPYFSFIFSFISILVITWPYLWEAPFKNFIQAFLNMSKFRWDGKILFFGEFARSLSLDWSYIPLWITITTPFLYLFFGTLGAIFIIAKFLKKPLKFLADFRNRHNLVYLFCFLAPIAAVIGMRSVMYDGWRQMYFIYPAFLLLGVYGISKVSTIFEKYYPEKNAKLIFGSIISIGFIFTLANMVINHPFQNVYFNSLISKKENYIRKNFEMDYWGASYKQSLEYILETDSSDNISISVANPPGIDNAMILRDEDRKRLSYTNDKEKAKYFISNYRLHPEEYEIPKMVKIKDIKAYNNNISSIWKRNE